MEDLGKSIPAGEALVDAETGGANKRHSDTCLNCGTKLIDTFCHHCGQKDIPRRQTLGELWTNFISSFWSYEGKFFQTAKYLMIKPGFLAMEYNAGRRETYFHPARMYVFISFVFFLIYFSLPDEEKTNVGVTRPKKQDTTKVAASDKKSLAPPSGTDDDDEDEIFDQDDKKELDSILNTKDPSDSILGPGFKDSLQNQIRRNAKKGKNNQNWNFGLQKAEFKTLQAYDSSQNARPAADRDGWFKRRLMIRAIELNNKYSDEGKSFGEDFGGAFKDNFSKVLFWLLPFFALVLKLLYVRRGFYYSEHLVFTIYYYNFFYFAGSLQMLLGLVSWLSWFPTIIGYWIFFYLLFAMKRMYGQSWGKTILKFSIFVFLFSILALVGLGISALAVLMMI